MTMLDRMRRHKNWSNGAWPSWWWRSCCSTSPTSFAAAAWVPAPRRRQPRRGRLGGRPGHHGRPVPPDYNQQMQAYRAAYGGSIDERLLKQMGIDRRILQQLIDEEAGLAEAAASASRPATRRCGRASSRFPAFQENGQFIGDARYRQLLQMPTRRCRRRSSKRKSAAA